VLHGRLKQCGACGAPAGQPVALAAKSGIDSKRAKQVMSYLRLCTLAFHADRDNERTDATVKQVDEIARKLPGIAHTFAISGYSSVLQANQPNVGAAFLVLDPFDKRPASRRGEKMLAEIRRQLSVVQEGRVIVLPPPPLRGLGNAGGFKLQVQDLNNAGLASLEVGRAARRGSTPELTSIISAIARTCPSTRRSIGEAKHGRGMADIGETLQTYLGPFTNDQFFGRTRQYAQAEPQFRSTRHGAPRLATRQKWCRWVRRPTGKTGGADRIQRSTFFPPHQRQYAAGDQFRSDDPKARTSGARAVARRFQHRVD
jgi:multidrug efflux pump